MSEQANTEADTRGAKEGKLLVNSSWHILPSTCCGQMCTTWKSIDHPATKLLSEYSTRDCATNMGADWSIERIKEAIAIGSHVSTMIPEAMEQLQKEVEEKDQKG